MVMFVVGLSCCAVRVSTFARVLFLFVRIS